MGRIRKFKIGTSRKGREQPPVLIRRRDGSALPPLGRGVNFEIRVSAVEPILAALIAADWPLFMAPEEKWYRTGAVETGVRQFLVQDPDGYLARFAATIGERRPA